MDIVFLGGISGCGKSTAGKYLEQSQRWKHLEIDMFPVDGLEHHNLAPQAKEFEASTHATRLVNTLKNRYSKYRGIILTFPSVVVFPAPHVNNNPDIKFRYMFGKPEHALRWFIEREQASGRNLSPTLWKTNNEHVYSALTSSFNSRLLINVFEKNGTWREQKAIQQNILDELL